MTVENEPGVVPMIAYADGAAAMDWLADVFGFCERLRLMDGDRLSQGEMETDFGTVLLASGPDSYEGPVATASTANRRTAGCQFLGSSMGCWCTWRTSPLTMTGLANSGLGLSRLRRAIGRACATGLRTSRDTGGCSCSGRTQILNDPAFGGTRAWARYRVVVRSRPSDGAPRVRRAAQRRPYPRTGVKDDG